MVDDLDRLDGLINQLLDAGRLEEGRIDADREMSPSTCCPESRQHGRPALPHAAGSLSDGTSALRIRAWQPIWTCVLFRNLIDKCSAVKYAASEPRWALICGGREMVV